MAQLISKTIRFPKELHDALHSEGEKFGATVNDMVVLAVSKFLGMPDQSAYDFFSALREWVVQTYDSNGFPEDVTLQVFHHIRDTPDVLAAYKRFAQTQEEKEVLHRRIGKLVKNALGAAVKGVSAPLDPAEHIIKTYSQLVPRK